MRKFGLILILVASVLLVLLPALFLLAWWLQSEYLTLLFTLFREMYFTLVPALYLLGIALFFYERISAYCEERSWTLYIWLALFLLSGLWYFFAYKASPESPFLQVDAVIPFAELVSPNLQVFSLYISLALVFIGGIFLFAHFKNLNFDTLKSGSLLLAFLIGLGFSFLLHRVPFIRQMEDQAIGIRYAWLRDPYGSIDPGTGQRYCSPPATEEERKKNADSGGIRITPQPDGVRDDIVILGVDNNTIERLQGKWPINWEHFGRLVTAVGKSKNSILLFDISFIDEKGVFGGEYCGERFQCSPKEGVTMARQSDVLADAIAASPTTTIADFPLEVTAETKDKIPAYGERMDLLASRARIENVKHIEYAPIWGQAMHPPYPKMIRALDGLGYANILKHSSGMNFQMPMVAKYHNEYSGRDEVYAGIDLVAAAKYYGVDIRKDVAVDFLKGEVRIENIPERSTEKINFDTLELEKVDIMKEPNAQRVVVIPIDRAGRMNINFRGGRYCFKNYGVLDFLDEYDRHENFIENFNDKIMLVAMYYATGVGAAKDIHLSPYGDMAGIEHHAYAINTVLNQDFALQVPPWVDLLILVFIALLMGFYQPRTATWASFVLALLIFATYTAVTLVVTFGMFSILHVFPLVIVEQFTVLVGFIGFRALSEEENVKFIRNTFSKFVSQDVVEELLANPDAITLGGSKKEVTVFFSDVRGFTTISEKLGPEELVQLLNEYLSEMTELIIDYRGTIDKYMGDAIMAFWGAPARNDDHAYFACVAALAQVEALRRLQEGWSDRNIPVLDIGIGINTGAAVVGNMGSSRRMDYTLMGDTVNLGSRLEGITKTYGVRSCISEFTYERVKDRVYARELDLVRVKGKLEPVRIYELMGLVKPEDINLLKVSRQTQANLEDE